MVIEVGAGGFFASRGTSLRVNRGRQYKRNKCPFIRTTAYKEARSGG